MRSASGLRGLVGVIVVALAGSVLVVAPVPLLPDPGGLLGPAEAEAQQVTSQAVLHRSTIVEGQTRAFQISNIPTRPEYYLHASVAGSFSAEASDVTITTNNLLGQALTVTPDADGPRAYPDAVYRHIRFEVTANGDSDGAGDETLGVRLCTTADCTGGAVLGEWTVTITEPAADTTLNGTGATVTIPGGRALSVMEDSANGDGRDRRATFSINITTAPTSDIAVVAYTETGVSTGAKMAPFARINSSLSPDYPLHGADGHNPVQAEYLVGYWASGATGSRDFTIISTDNVADSPGGTISGNLKFKVLVNDSSFGDENGGATAYSGITIPDLPVSVTDDDEPTRVRLLPTSPADNEATEGNTDKATVLVKLDRALVAGEEVTALLTFIGAVLGTNFTLAAQSGQTGVTYANSSDGTQGLVTLAGAGLQEGVIEVTALTDTDSDSQTLQIGMPPYDQPWRDNFHRSNLDGGVCAAHGCPDRPQDDPGQRFQSVTLAEAVPGLTITEHADPDARVVTEGKDYSYTLQLNTAPSNAVTITTTIASGGSVQAGGTLTFTSGNYAMPQTVTVRPADNNMDEANRTLTVTHAFSGDTTYAALSNVTHEVSVLDDDATTITMATSNSGLRLDGRGNNISRIMVEGDATRVDRSLTISLGRALADGEYVRVPLRVEAVANGNDPSLPEDPPDRDDDDDPELPRDLDPRRTVVDSFRGPRASANVAWPPIHNDVVMTATGTGVTYEHSNRHTPNHIGFRYIEFRGAGAQTATIVIHARDGFDDGESYDEAFAITFPYDLRAFDEDTDEPLSSSPVDSNLGGGIAVTQEGVEAWFGITDDDEAVVEGRDVAPDWAPLPAGLSPGDQFRLIYVTSQETAATSGDISTYDAFVRAEITGNDLVNGGVTAMIPYADSFRVVGEAVALAHDHARFDADNSEHPNVPIYWVGGSKVADDNSDFADGRDWDDEANPRHADGTAATVHTDGYWTGTGYTGHLRNYGGFWSCSWGSQGYPEYPHLGRSRVSVGYLNATDRYHFNPLGPEPFSGEDPGQGFCHSFPSSQMRPMYALSGLFTVVGEVSIEGGEATEGSPVTFTVSRPVAEASPTTVTYTLSNGRGVTADPAYSIATGAAGGSGADYTNDYAGVGTVTIAANQRVASFTVPTTQDNTYEGNHYFNVKLTGTDSQTIDVRNDTAIGTITDAADAPSLQFSPASVSASEMGGTATLTVIRTRATLVPSSVTWTTADGTGASGATHPGDYTSATGTVQFAPNVASQTITVDITADSTAESAETFSVQLSDPVEATLGSAARATVTVTDADVGPLPTVDVTLSASAGVAVEGVAGPTLTVAISRALTAGETVTVPLTFEGATVADDYRLVDAIVASGVSLVDSGGTHTAQNPAVLFTGSGTTAPLRIDFSENDDRTQPYLVVDYGTADRAPSGGGVTVGTLAGGPVGVVLQDDETGDIEVPADWPLAPSGLSAGDDFRLLLRTSTARDATSSDIADYDTFVRRVLATGGHADILPYAGFFKVLGSTRSGSGSSGATARFHNGLVTSGEHNDHHDQAGDGWADGSARSTRGTVATPVYWLNGAIIANNYADLCDISWTGSGAGVRDGFDQNDPRSEDGTQNIPDGNVTNSQRYEPWTGSGNACEAWSHPLGASTVSRGGHSGANNLLHAAAAANTQERPLLGLSPVFKEAALPVLGFARATSLVNEDDGTLSVTVNADPAPGANLTVSYTVLDSSSGQAGLEATSGSDFTAPSGSFTIDAGATSGTIVIAITDDDVFEKPEALRLTLTASSGYTVDAPRGNTTVSISDNDRAELTLGQASYTVLESGGTVAVIVDLSETAPDAVNVRLTLADGTATGSSGGAGADFDSDVLTATIAAGSDTATFSIPITGDGAAEADETFTATLSKGSGGVTANTDIGSPHVATVTIADDDHAQGLLFAPPAATGLTLDEGATATYTVRPATAPTGTVTVTITGAGSGITVDTDPSMASDQNTLTFTTSDWYIAQEVTVSAGQDLNAANEMVTLTHAPTGGGYSSSHNADFVVTADDDETLATPVTVTMSASDGDSDGDAVENGAGTTGYRTITITLGRALTGAETVTVPLTVQGATVADDYTFDLQPGTQTGVTLLNSGATYTAQNPALRFVSGGTAATLRLRPVNDSDRTQPYVVVGFGTDSRAPSGVNVTLGTVSGGPIGVVLVDDETGAIEVPSSWGLVPASGVGAGDDFRLLFRTSTGRDATSGDIADYDAFVRMVLATGGHADILPYAGFFKVLGSTRSQSGSTGTTARVHNDMADEHTGATPSGGWADGSAASSVGDGAVGVPIYWLNGAILANNYADLCDLAWSSGSGVTTGWDTDDPRSEDGTRNIPTGSISDYRPYEPWTGTGNTCEAYNYPLGAAQVSKGSADRGGGQTLFHTIALGANTEQRPLYGMSPVFTVEGTAAELGVSAGGTVTEGGTLTVTVTLSKNAASNLSVPVRMRTSGNPTASAADFTLSDGGSVAITSGTSSGTLTFTAVDDDIDEDAETLVLEFGALPAGVVAGSTDSVSITINDNDTAGVTVTQTGGNTAVAEDGGTDAYTVALDTQPLSNVVVTLTSGASTAALLSGGSQSDQGAVTLTFTPASWGAQTVTVRGVDDDIDNENDRRDVTITQAVTTGDTNGKYTTSTNVADVSVRVDDDDTAAVTITGGPLTVNEDQSDTGTYTVALATQPVADITVTATAPAGTRVSDDGGSTWGSSLDLVFTSGTSGNWATAQTVTVRGHQDIIDNPGDQRAGTITHAITSGNGDGIRYTPTTPTKPGVAVTVTDDDAAPTAITLSVDDDLIREGDGATTITVTATVQGATRFGAPKAVVVTVTPLADRTGFNYVDMAAVGAFTINIDAGAQTATGMFTLTPDDDIVAEAHNLVAVTGSISGDTATTINPDEILLQDDDATPTVVSLSVNPMSVTENGGARNIAVTATVDGGTRFGNAKTVAVTVAGHNADGQVNFSQVAGFNIIINAEANTGTGSFTLTPTNNNWDEMDGAAALSGTLSGVTVTGASVTVTDDDAAPSGVALGVNTASIAEDAGATTVTVTATVQGATRYGSDRTVTVSQAGSGNADAVDYTATTPAAITIPAGQTSRTTTFTLTPTDDATDEYDETVTVSGTGAGVAGFSDATITLTDDDDTTVAIGAPAGGIAESGGTKDVTLTLSRALLTGETVTVPLEVVGATAGTDYRVALQPSSQTGVALSQSGPDSAQQPKVTLTTGASGAVLRFTAVDDVRRQQPYLVVGYGSGARTPSGDGVDFTAPSDGPVGFVITDDETGAVGVLPSWGLLPTATATSRGDFRLVLVTSGQRDASSGDIADYDHFIRLHLAEGHPDIVPYAGFFTALGSTSSVTLADHAGVTGSASMDFFWLGETGTTGERRLAASNAQFRGEWFTGSSPSQQSVPRDESGTLVSPAAGGYFTGSTAAGARSGNPLGSASVTLGYLNDGGAGRAPLGSAQTASGTATRGFYGLSPVFSYTSDPVISVTSATARVTEGTAITYTIEASPAPTADLPVNLAVGDGGHVVAPAATGIKNGAATIQANTTSVTYTVNTVADSTDEPDTAVTVGIISGSNYVLSATMHTAVVTVTDNDAMTVSVSGGGGTVNEGASLDYTVDPGRTLGSGETVTVNFAPAGTATRGSDYTITCHGTGVTCTGLAGATPTMTIRGGTSVRRGTIRVSAQADSIHPESETAGISLRAGHMSTGSGGAFSVSGTPSTFTITSIAPAAITASFGAAAYSGGEAAGSRTVTIPVSLSAAAPAGGLSVAYAAHSSGTAVSADYGVSPAGSVSITQGASSASITVTITDDVLHEGSETVVLDISGGSGYSAGATARTTVTITDDDAAPTTVALSVDDTSVGEADGATTITVTATVGGSTRWGAAQTVAVVVAGSGGQGVVGFTAQPAAFDISIAAGARTGTGMFTLTPTDDNTVENAETVTVSGTHGSATVSPATITLTDDDTAPAAPVTVTMGASGGDADGNAVEGASDAAGYRTITITLGRALTGSETVTVPLTVQGATVATDYAFALQPSSQAGVTLLTSNPHSAQDPAVRLAAGASSATLRLTPVDNGARTQPYVVIAYGAGSRAPSGSGVTLGTVSGGPVGVVLVDDETGDVTVPAGWGLKPSALGAGDDFRLLFRSSTSRDATSADIGVYDAFIRDVVATMGHADIVAYAGFFQVFASTRSSTGSTGTTARVHTGMAAEHTSHVPSGGWSDGSAASSVGDAGVGTPIYWLNGEILANNYADLCDQAMSSGSGVTTGWDLTDPRSEDGTQNNPGSPGQAQQAWTGSGNACEAYTFPLGNSPNVSRAGTHFTTWAFMHQTDEPASEQRPLYGLSPVFKVAGTTPSAVAVGFERARYNVREGTTLQVTLTAAGASSASATFTVNATAGTATSGDWSGGPWSVTLPANQTSVSFNVVIPSDSAIEGPERFTLTIAAPPAGFTLGTGTATVQIVDVNVVPGDWALIPAGLTTGRQFRLVFLGDPHPASDGNIATYDGWVSADASSAGTTPTPHADIQAYSAGFQVVGSTAAVDAAAHTATGISESGAYAHTAWTTPVYWLGGARIADDHNDFWDGSWDHQLSGQTRGPDGQAVSGAAKTWTGTQTGATHATAGTASANPLGHTGSNVTLGQWGSGNDPISQAAEAKTGNRRLLAISQVFEVGATPQTPVADFAAATSTVAEASGTTNIRLNLSPAPASTITVRYTLSGTATRGTDYTISGGSGASRTVNVGGGATFVDIPVAVTNDNAQESSETIILTLDTGTGYSVGTTNAAHTRTITDDDTGGGTPIASFAAASSRVGEASGTTSLVVNFQPRAVQRHHPQVRAVGHRGARRGLHHQRRVGHEPNAERQRRDDVGEHPHRHRRRQRTGERRDHHRDAAQQHPVRAQRAAHPHPHDHRRRHHEPAPAAATAAAGSVGPAAGCSGARARAGAGHRARDVRGLRGGVGRPASRDGPRPREGLAQRGRLRRRDAVPGRRDAPLAGGGDDRAGRRRRRARPGDQDAFRRRGSHGVVGRPRAAPLPAPDHLRLCRGPVLSRGAHHPGRGRLTAGTRLRADRADPGDLLGPRPRQRARRRGRRSALLRRHLRLRTRRATATAPISR